MFPCVTNIYRYAELRHTHQKALTGFTCRFPISFQLLSLLYDGCHHLSCILEQPCSTTSAGEPCPALPTPVIQLWGSQISKTPTATRKKLLRG